jgi:1-deoxy-D-xylulose-5-phosphate synthase
LIHDVAIQNLPVVFALDRAGLVGADGATHAGAYDVAYLRCVPNVSVACPSDENECHQLLSTAFAQNHPVAVRYPRGAGAGVAVHAGLEPLPFGKGEIRRNGKGVALEAANALNATVVNMRWAKPLDTALLLQVASNHEALVTVEDGCIMGGAGSAVLEALQAADVEVPVLQLGLQDVFVEHGDPARLMTLHGLDTAGIQASITRRFSALLAPRARAA